MFVVFLITVLVKCVCCHRVELVTTFEGYHCGNISILDNETMIDHYHCAQCFFPQNCQTNNTCAVGTEGYTCEKCVSGYHRVGNACVQCTTVPWAAIAFGVYILLLGVAACHSRFAGSVTTKFKLLCHFLQLLVLSSHIKVTLSNFSLQIFSILSFAKFSTDIITLECLLFSWPAIQVQYLEWLVILLVLLIVAVFGFLFDRSLKLVKSKEKEPTRMMRVNMQRLAIRRFIFMVFLVLYMPVTLTALRAYSCSDNMQMELVLDLTKDVYLLDNEHSCAEFIFQTLQFIGIIYLVVFSLLFPFLLVFFTLRQRKWNLLDTDRMKYGPVYDAYKNRYCFWEAIVLLRILISLVLTDTYPFSPYIQVYGQLTLTGLYLLLVIIFRPYRTMAWRFCTANNHVMFEVLSNLCLGFVQTVSHPVFQNYWSILEIISLVFICCVILLWVVLLFGICCEIKEEQSDFQETKEESSVSASQTIHKKKAKFLCCRSNAVGPDPTYTAELQEKRGTLDF